MNERGIFKDLEHRIGFVPMGVSNPQFQLKDLATRNFQLAQDAQPSLITQGSNGIPAYLTSVYDPRMIDILVQPMNMAKIIGGEIKKGTWLDDTMIFMTVEATGQTSSYGDYSNNGVAGVNVNWPQRQAYHFQVITEYGEREQERAGLARLDLANQKNRAAALTLNKFMNKSYAYGVNVSGLQNVGLLNDPSLFAPIMPTTQSGQTSWTNKDANGILADVAALYAQLQAQAPGIAELDADMVLAMSPKAQANMTKTTQFNVSIIDMLRKNFPNLKIETAPEYSTTSGELVQLIVREYDGLPTAEAAFTEKLRQHPVVTGLSNFAQKKSAGTWGTVIYRPFLIAQMLGV